MPLQSRLSVRPLTTTRAAPARGTGSSSDSTSAPVPRARPRLSGVAACGQENRRNPTCASARARGAERGALTSRPRGDLRGAARTRARARVSHPRTQPAVGSSSAQSNEPGASNIRQASRHAGKADAVGGRFEATRTGSTSTKRKTLE
eukprot:365300-Chlamydomonas_euryale.AAC.5